MYNNMQGLVWDGVNFIDPNTNLPCLLYTSDAADERSSVDLGGRRIIKKKTYCSTDAAVSTLYVKNTQY